MRIFFATDIHGSEVCWRKFLNAAAFHKADVLIMGGDMTGKAMVPIVAENGGWRLTLQEQEHVLATEAELTAMEKRILDRGYYPVRLSRDELDAWNADQALVDARFKAEMLGAAHIVIPPPPHEGRLWIGVLPSHQGRYEDHLVHAALSSVENVARSAIFASIPALQTAARAALEAAGFEAHRRLTHMRLTLH